MITASVNNTNIFRYIGTLSDGDNYSHNLVHIHTNEKPVNEIINGHTFVNSPYTSCELKFASTIVGNKVFARLKEFYKEETYKFVASVSLLGSVRGYVFEIIAHNELSAGKTFLTRSLEESKKSCVKSVKERKLRLLQLTKKLVTHQMTLKMVNTVNRQQRISKLSIPSILEKIIILHFK
ncbi:hypothetical protein RirG_232200 [Rhizophagus irregularis DAOM 197198w]|uniref:Uncharacterized protein n=1 Tax=Rhizophagus irregularis (strain DAOM 197198w) TaxID=1432141 RepID=A0A015IKN4_RHIIW|nr:hypothetical protein RirG_232200 [Rhizophagus irregularis DAOM 197198w]